MIEAGEAEPFASLSPSRVARTLLSHTVRLQVTPAQALRIKRAAPDSSARLASANKDFVATGERLLELRKGLGETYLTKEAAEQAELVKILCSNLTTDGAMVSATYAKPFDVLAERSHNEGWLLG